MNLRCKLFWTYEQQALKNLTFKLTTCKIDSLYAESATVNYCVFPQDDDRIVILGFLGVRISWNSA